ncbi:hypothetical protein RJ639_008067, partial [Escallonia herrerae]
MSGCTGSQASFVASSPGDNNKRRNRTAISSMQPSKQARIGERCTYCNWTGHTENECLRKMGLRIRCAQPGDIGSNCPCSRNQIVPRDNQGRGNLKGNTEKPRMQGRAYGLESQEVRDANGVIEGTLTIFQCVARVLFDPGSTHSFISSYMVSMLPQEPELLPYVLEVSTPKDGGQDGHNPQVNVEEHSTGNNNHLMNSGLLEACQILQQVVDEIRQMGGNPPLDTNVQESIGYIEIDLEEQKNANIEQFRALPYGGQGNRNSGNVNPGGRSQGNAWQGNFQRALQGRNRNFYRNGQGRGQGNQMSGCTGSQASFVASSPGDNNKRRNQTAISSMQPSKQARIGERCTYCNWTGHTENECLRKMGLCIRCAPPGDIGSNCPCSRNQIVPRDNQGRGNLQGNTEKPRMQGRAYGLESQEVRDANGVIEGTLTIFQCVARVLFDPGSTYSFISSYMVSMLPQEPELLPYVLEVSTPKDGGQDGHNPQVNVEEHSTGNNNHLTNSGLLEACQILQQAVDEIRQMGGNPPLDTNVQEVVNAGNVRGAQQVEQPREMLNTAQSIGYFENDLEEQKNANIEQFRALSYGGQGNRNGGNVNPGGRSQGNAWQGNFQRALQGRNRNFYRNGQGRGQGNQMSGCTGSQASFVASSPGDNNKRRNRTAISSMQPSKQARIGERCTYCNWTGHTEDECLRKMGLRIRCAQPGDIGSNCPCSRNQIVPRDNQGRGNLKGNTEKPRMQGRAYGLESQEVRDANGVIEGQDGHNPQVNVEEHSTGNNNHLTNSGLLEACQILQQAVDEIRQMGGNPPLDTNVQEVVNAGNVRGAQQVEQPREMLNTAQSIGYFENDLEEQKNANIEQFRALSYGGQGNRNGGNVNPGGRSQGNAWQGNFQRALQGRNRNFYRNGQGRGQGNQMSGCTGSQASFVASSPGDNNKRRNRTAISSMQPSKQARIGERCTYCNWTGHTEDECLRKMGLRIRCAQPGDIGSNCPCSRNQIVPRDNQGRGNLKGNTEKPRMQGRAYGLESQEVRDANGVIEGQDGHNPQVNVEEHSTGNNNHLTNSGLLEACQILQQAVDEIRQMGGNPPLDTNVQEVVNAGNVRGAQQVEQPREMLNTAQSIGYFENDLEEQKNANIEQFRALSYGGQGNRNGGNVNPGGRSQGNAWQGNFQRALQGRNRNFYRNGQGRGQGNQMSGCTGSQASFVASSPGDNNKRRNRTAISSMQPSKQARIGERCTYCNWTGHTEDECLRKMGLRIRCAQPGDIGSNCPCSRNQIVPRDNQGRGNLKGNTEKPRMQGRAYGLESQEVRDANGVIEGQDGHNPQVNVEEHSTGNNNHLTNSGLLEACQILQQAVDEIRQMGGNPPLDTNVQEVVNAGNVRGAQQVEQPREMLNTAQSIGYFENDLEEQKNANIEQFRALSYGGQGNRNGGNVNPGGRSQGNAWQGNFQRALQGRNRNFYRNGQGRGQGNQMSGCTGSQASFVASSPGDNNKRRNRTAISSMQPSKQARIGERCTYCNWTGHTEDECLRKMGLRIRCAQPGDIGSNCPCSRNQIVPRDNQGRGNLKGNTEKPRMQGRAYGLESQEVRDANGVIEGQDGHNPQVNVEEHSTGNNNHLTNSGLLEACQILQQAVDEIRQMGGNPPLDTNVQEVVNAGNVRGAQQVEQPREMLNTAQSIGYFENDLEEQKNANIEQFRALSYGGQGNRNGGNVNPGGRSQGNAWQGNFQRALQGRNRNFYRNGQGRGQGNQMSGCTGSQASFVASSPGDNNKRRNRTAISSMQPSKQARIGERCTYCNWTGHTEDECLRKMGLRIRCAQPGDIGSNCPCSRNQIVPRDNQGRGNLKGNTEKPRMQGRAYGLESQEVRDANGVIEGQDGHNPQVNVEEHSTGNNNHLTNSGLLEACQILQQAVDEIRQMGGNPPLDTNVQEVVNAGNVRGAQQVEQPREMLNTAQSIGYFENDLEEQKNANIEQFRALSYGGQGNRNGGNVNPGGRSQGNAWQGNFQRALQGRNRNFYRNGQGRGQGNQMSGCTGSQASFVASSPGDNNKRRNRTAISSMQPSKQARIGERCTYCNWTGHTEDECLRKMGLRIRCAQPGDIGSNCPCSRNQIVPRDNQGRGNLKGNTEKPRMQGRAYGLESQEVRDANGVIE